MKFLARLFFCILAIPWNLLALVVVSVCFFVIGLGFLGNWAWEDNVKWNQVWKWKNWNGMFVVPWRK